MTTTPSSTSSQEKPPVRVEEDVTIEVEDPGPVLLTQSAGDKKPPGSNAAAGMEEPPQQPDERTRQLNIELNKKALKRLIRLLGSVAESLTRVPDVACDEEEEDTLAEAWAPILPQMSPAAAAIIATVIVVGGKVAIYLECRRERKQKEREAGEMPPPPPGS